MERLCNVEGQYGGDTFPTVKPSDRVYQRPYKRFNTTAPPKLKRTVSVSGQSIYDGGALP